MLNNQDNSLTLASLVINNLLEEEAITFLTASDFWKEKIIYE